MKILIIGPAYPLRGGIAQFLARLHQAFGDAGHDCVFHSFIRQYPKFLFPGKTQDDSSDSVMDVGAVASLDPLNPFNWPFAARRIVSEDPDVIVLKWWMPFFGPAYTLTLQLARMFCGAKVVFIVDNAIPHETRPGDMMITRAGFGVADGFVVMSKTVRDDLLSIKPDANYALTPHPLYDVFGEPGDMDRAKAALGVSGKTLLFFGFVRAYKGLMVLLDAMPSIIERLGEVTLLVAGEFYEDKQPYMDRMEKLGIAGQVKVVDEFIPNEAVADYFSASDLLVMPYLSATQSGITQIAYSFGMPVVATNVGGLPEVVVDGKTGYLVPPDDPEALAAAVARYFDEGKRDEFKKAIDKEKHRFSWETMVAAITGLTVSADDNQEGGRHGG